MKVWINNIIVFINQLSLLERYALAGVFLIFTVFAIISTLKAYYNAKTLTLKILPIILTAISLTITLFILFC